MVIKKSPCFAGGLFLTVFNQDPSFACGPKRTSEVKVNG